MALRHTGISSMGVPIHPESILTEYGHEICVNFLQIEAGGLDSVKPAPDLRRCQTRPHQWLYAHQNRYQ